MTVKEGENNEQSVSTAQNDEVMEYSDLYPGRKQTQTRNWWHKLLFMEYNEQICKKNCEANVIQCVKNSPLVKLMMAAIKSSGCEIDIGRHISCEVCDNKITGGYDPHLNQVIICQNTATTRNKVQSTLSHEMVHMFDYCRNNMNLHNIDHLACTEIRAANLCHCSFLGAVTRGKASFINVKQTHQECVKDKAVRSIMALKNLSKDEATAAVLRVFTKCYNDLEPVGRRLRRNSLDMEKAYYEGPLYGYTH